MGRGLHLKKPCLGVLLLCRCIRPSTWSSLFPEMFEALRPQIPNPILFRNADFPRLISNFANARDLYTVHSFWQPRHVIGPDSEKQFEILAPMQGQHQRIQRAPAAEPDYIPVDWQRR